MFDRMVDFFKGKGKSLVIDTNGKATEKDVQVATAILLLEIAGSDSDYAPEETKAVFELMENQFHLEREECLALLEMADTMRQNADKLDEFYVAINRAFSPEQRVLLFAMIWRVVIADGRVDKDEMKQATQMRFRLKLSDAEFERAKKQAEQGWV